MERALVAAEIGPGFSSRSSTAGFAPERSDAEADIFSQGPPFMKSSRAGRVAVLPPSRNRVCFAASCCANRPRPGRFVTSSPLLKPYRTP